MLYLTVKDHLIRHVPALVPRPTGSLLDFMPRPRPTAMNYLEVLAADQMPTCVDCGVQKVDDGGMTAFWRCTNCQGALCDDCHHDHSTWCGAFGPWPVPDSEEESPTQRSQAAGHDQTNNVTPEPNCQVCGNFAPYNVQFQARVRRMRNARFKNLARCTLCSTLFGKCCYDSVSDYMMLCNRHKPAAAPEKEELFYQQIDSVNVEMKEEDAEILIENKEDNDLKWEDQVIRAIDSPMPFWRKVGNSIGAFLAIALGVSSLCTPMSAYPTAPHLQ